MIQAGATTINLPDTVAPVEAGGLGSIQPSRHGDVTSSGCLGNGSSDGQVTRAAL